MACICGFYFVSLFIQPYFLAPSGIVSKRLCVLGVKGVGWLGECIRIAMEKVKRPTHPPLSLS